MKIYIIDTHALIWFLEGSSKLSAPARAVLEEPDATFLFPVIAFAEAMAMIEKRRTPLTREQFLDALDNEPRLHVVPLDRELMQIAFELPSTLEMHDRIIGAVATAAKVAPEFCGLVTKDAALTSTGIVPTIW